MKTFLVIGIGSLIMRDDGIGTRVVKALSERQVYPDITFFAGETDFQCAFDKIEDYVFFIIVDAMVSGEKAGSVEVMSLSDVFKNRGKMRTQHDFCLFDEIFLRAPKSKGWLIGIEAAKIEMGTELSGEISEKFDFICDEVEAEILKIRDKVH